MIPDNYACTMIKDVTVVVTAFDRPEALKIFLESVRKYYPKIPIIVTDNGHYHPELNRYFEREYDCKYLQHAYDSGANNARKLGMSAVRTKYAVICEDDFIFDERTNLESFKKILEIEPACGLVGGIVEHEGRKGIIGSEMIIDRENESFHRNALRKPDCKHIDGVAYYFCDYVRMFFMKRKEMRLNWEEKIYPSGSGSHMSIFLKLMENKRNKWRVAFTHDVTVLHKRIRSDPGYKALRLGRREAFKKKFYLDTGFRYGVFNGLRVQDFKLAKKISIIDYYNKIQEKHEG